MLSQCPGHYGLCAFFVTALYYVTFIQGIQRFSVNEGLCSRLCLNLCNYAETAVSQLNGWLVSRLNCCWPSPAQSFLTGLLKIHVKDFYSLLDVYVFRNLASSPTKEGSSESESESELLYDWHFTANHFILVTSPLRLTPSIFLN
jgi:hypothetical protein